MYSERPFSRKKKTPISNRLKASGQTILKKKNTEIESGEKCRTKSSILDTIVKAVATGIFIFSIALNVFLIITLGLIITARNEVSAVTTGGARYVKQYIKGGKNTKWEFVVLDLKGVITSSAQKEGFSYRESMVEAFKNRIKLIREDSTVKAVILMIDSPGGAVTASDMIYQELMKLKEDTGLPIVSFIQDIGASGAYYIASASDIIAAYPTAITGSIGVIMYNFNIKALMEKYGVKYIAVKSGAHKDLLSPFKDVDKEEVKWMQGIIDELYNRFVEIVAKGRPNLDKRAVRKLADGRVYTANIAYNLGLVDFVGSFNDLLNKVSNITGVKDYSVFRYVREKQLGNILDLFSILTDVKLFEFKKNLLPFDSSSTVKAYYIFEPAFSNTD